MKRIVWYTLLPWLILLAGAVAVVMGDLFISHELYWFVGLVLPLLIPGVGLCAGYMAGVGKANAAATLVIALLVSICLAPLLRSRFVLFGMILLFFLLIRFFVRLQREGDREKELRRVVGVLTVIVAISSVYVSEAYFSKWGYSILNPDVFYYYPQCNTAQAVYENEDGTFAAVSKLERPYEGNQIVAVGEDGQELYTGPVFGYGEKLRLDVTPKKISGVSYYINGRYWGTSGEGSYLGVAVKGAHHHYIPVEQHDLHSSSSFIPVEQYNPQWSESEFLFLHKDYIRTVEKELESWGDFYCEDVASRTGSKRKMAVFERDRTLYRAEISYHKNSVIKSIEYSSHSEDGWKYQNQWIHFDPLGAPVSSLLDADGGIHYKTDFMPVPSMDLKSLVENHQTSDKDFIVKFTAPEKMDFAPDPDGWRQHDTIFDNLLSSYGFSPETKIEMYVQGAEGDYVPVDQGGVDTISSVLSYGRLTIDVLSKDASWQEYQWKNAGAKIVIKSYNDQDKQLKLYYYNGRFLVDSGPYFIDLHSGLEKEADDRQRMEQWRKLMDFLKGIAGKPPETDDSSDSG